MPIPCARLFAPLPTPAEMAAWDRESIQRYHIPEFALMENASREAFEAALGCPVYDEFALYQQAEERSKRRCGLL